MIPAMRFAAAAVGVTIALALVAAESSPASATDESPSVRISLDGVDFAPDPSATLFGHGVVLVPGATETGVFYVRNDSDMRARLGVAVADASATSDAFIESLSLAAGTDGSGPGTPVPLESGNPCQPLLEGDVLDPGEVTEVQITLAMAKSATTGQSSTASTRLAVTLTDAAVEAQPVAECASEGGLPVFTPLGEAGPGGASPVGAVSPEPGVAAGGTSTTTAPGAGPLVPGALPTLALPGMPAAALPLTGAGLLVLAGFLFLFLLLRKRRGDETE